MLKDILPDTIVPLLTGFLIFASALAAKLQVGDELDMLELAPHGLIAVVMVLLLYFFPRLLKTIIEMNEQKEKEIQQIFERVEAQKEKEIHRITNIYESMLKDNRK